MDTSHILPRIEKGEFLTIGEYRHSKSEMISWRDKTNGRPMTAPILRHTVECGDTSVAVSERLPDSITKLEDIPPVKFAKGEPVILVLEELTKNLGLVSAKGKLEKVSQPSAGNGKPAGGSRT